MARQGRAARAAIGMLNVLFGALAIGGGGQMLFLFREASATGIVVGAAGLMAGIFFALAGLAIWRGWPQARAFGLSASAVTIAVYAAGVGVHIIGFSGLLYGVAYPALLIAWLVWPRSGLGRAERTEPEADRPGPAPRDLRRMGTVTA